MKQATARVWFNSDLWRDQKKGDILAYCIQFKKVAESTTDEVLIYINISARSNVNAKKRETYWLGATRPSRKKKKKKNQNKIEGYAMPFLESAYQLLVSCGNASKSS